jgi:transcriptional regulator GlxA family with amidase domain
MNILGMDEPWDLAKLAVQNKINPKRLRDMFKKHVGMPTSVFKISVRIEKASHLLADTSLKIQDISLQVGYPNPAHFAKLFKLKTGRSPSKFRKESRMGGKKGT